MAYGEPDSGLLHRNPCGEPPRGPGPSQHIDHAWKRAATRRSGAPAGIARNLSLSTWSVLVAQMIWLMAMGILMPNAMAGAVSPFPTMAGAAASLQGFAMMAARPRRRRRVACFNDVRARRGRHSDFCLGEPTGLRDSYVRSRAARHRERASADKWGAVPSSRLIRPRRTAAVARGSADLASSITPRQGLVRFAPIVLKNSGRLPLGATLESAQPGL